MFNDFGWFQKINGFAALHSAWNPLMKFLAEDAEYLFYAGIIVYWFLRSGENRRMVTEAILSACCGLGISGVIGLFFYRDRPFVRHNVLQLIPHSANASFPSDHAVGAFVIAASIFMLRKKDGIAWLILAALIAFSRIWVGVHYPSDVLAGALLGIASAIFVHTLFARWHTGQRLIRHVIDFYEKSERKIILKVRHKSV